MRFLLLLLLVAAALLTYFLRQPERWVAYYGAALPPQAFQPYRVIVFDRQRHPDLTLLKAQHKILLGYVSLGEAETSRDDFPSLKDRHLLLATGADWKGNPMIDVRRPEWNEYILQTLIPGILQQGFDGVMLDTADSPLWLEKQYPQRYAGLQQATAQLIKNIRAGYPHIVIMLNRGFELLPEVGGAIDMSLAESIYGDGKDMTPYQHYVQLLKTAKRRYPNLKIYSLDYRPPDDRKGIRRIYAIQRAQGFIPYVTTQDLQSVTPEP